jgi:hypothetical protein
MEERERDERVEGVGEELLLGEGEVGGLEVVGGDHGCVRAQEEETMAMAGRRRTTGAGVKKGIEEDKRDAGDGNVFFSPFIYFLFVYRKTRVRVFLNWPLSLTRLS